MIIREMTIGDYQEVFALWMATPGMGLNETDDSRQGISRYLQRNPSTCFVAVQNNSICGVILAGHDGRRGLVHHTAVARASQHQGIGTALVKAVLAALKKQGIHKVFLVAYKNNADGNAFWQKQGFNVRDDLVYRDYSLSPLTKIDPALSEKL